MILKIAIKLSLICITILINGCDSFNKGNVNLNHICEESPELCNDLHKITDCRYMRTSVIRARYYDKVEPSVIHRQQLLNELDEYHSCLDITILKQFTRHKERKIQSLENFYKAEELIEQLLKESKGTKDPLLAYYLWTHHQDLQAKKQFLSIATKSDVIDPQIIFKLATIYVKENPQLALNHFYRGMQLSTSLDNISTSIFAMIMSIFYQNEQFEDAYIWALISLKQDKESEYPINLDLILKNGHLGGINIITNEDHLAEQADGYYQKLKLGTFNLQAPTLE